MVHSSAITSERFGSGFIQWLRTLSVWVEKRRIAHHLRLTEEWLRRKKVDHLSSELRSSRLLHLDHLREYWQRGLFPVNSDFQGTRVPYFKDYRGVSCAVAYLMERSGAQELVDHVVAHDNQVLVSALRDGPALDWILQSGLTQEEAATIQPGYSADWFQSEGGMYHKSSMQFFLEVIASAALFLVLEWLIYLFARRLFPHQKTKMLLSFTLLSVPIVTGLVLWLNAFM